MWSEKIIVSRQRLPKDFGRVILRFCRHLDSREQSDSDTRQWRGRISVERTASGSEWVIKLSGRETTRRREYAIVTGKSPLLVKNYRVEILASLLLRDRIKLEVQENVEHWPKLEGLWKKLWAELERQGYKEAPALDVTSRASEDRQAETVFRPVPWGVEPPPFGQSSEPGHNENAPKAGGRPGLKHDDLIYRLVAAREAEEARTNDPAMTWKEIARAIRWRYGSKPAGVKLLEDARKRLARLQKDDPEHLLAEASEWRKT